jgi:hypothetical protein
MNEDHAHRHAAEQRGSVFGFLHRHLPQMP